MAYEEINILSEETRQISEQIKKESVETPYKKNDWDDIMSGNGGNAYNAMHTINSKTDICVNVTRQLFCCTSEFLKHAADNFEDLDISIASEVSSS